MNDSVDAKISKLMDMSGASAEEAAEAFEKSGGDAAGAMSYLNIRSKVSAMKASSLTELASNNGSKSHITSKKGNDSIANTRQASPSLAARNGATNTIDQEENNTKDRADNGKNGFELTPYHLICLTFMTSHVMLHGKKTELIGRELMLQSHGSLELPLLLQVLSPSMGLMAHRTTMAFLGRNKRAALLARTLVHLPPWSPSLRESFSTVKKITKNYNYNFNESNIS